TTSLCGLGWCCHLWHRFWSKASRQPAFEFRRGSWRERRLNAGRSSRCFTASRRSGGEAMWARFAVAAFLVVFAGRAFSQENYRVDPLHTATTFSVSHLGLSLQRGSFGRTTGMVTLDRTAGKGSIDVAIDAASVTSGSPSRELMLKGDEYFNVGQFPL